MKPTMHNIRPHQPGEGLTTTRATFIEDAQAAGRLFIDQPYELYSDQNQATWRQLYAHMLPLWQTHAHPRFLEGVENLMLNPHHLPRLTDINQQLTTLTGFKAKAVAGYVPAYLFFDCLRQRIFPTTITIRDGAKLEYLPEPDIFHDVAGHVPMHTDRRFSDVLVRFGEIARLAALRAQAIGDERRRIKTVESNIQALARFFWFTVEFGLMHHPTQRGRLTACGSGLLSSLGELHHCIESKEVQRYPAQIEWMINQSFEIDHFQPLLFICDSFDHLFDMVDSLASLLDSGRLDHVAPGEPGINERDLDSFLKAEIAV